MTQSILGKIFKNIFVLYPCSHAPIKNCLLDLSTVIIFKRASILALIDTCSYLFMIWSLDLKLIWPTGLDQWCWSGATTRCHFTTSMSTAPTAVNSIVPIFIIQYKSVQYNVLVESFNVKAISKLPNKVVIFSTPLQLSSVFQGQNCWKPHKMGPP